MSRNFNNGILAGLSQDDLSLLGPLTLVDLPKRRPLELSNRRIDAIFFPESGVASVVARGSNGRTVDVGMIGSDGMTGDAIVMGEDRTPLETRMRIGGAGHSLPASRLVGALANSATLRKACLRSCHVFAVQSAYGALSNATNSLPARLARWLLMADDRVAGGELALTHELLAVTMGVRRAGVTNALNKFFAAEVITKQRGHIRILSREALIEKCGGTYLMPGQDRPHGVQPSVSSDLHLSITSPLIS